MDPQSDSTKTHGGSTGGGQELAPPKTIQEAIIRLLHPIPLTILLILMGATFLIGSNVMGWDSGEVLNRMSRHEFARGLITYLFAITTIGTSVVLVMAALMREISEDAYIRGKEVLALLLGIFGTIVGFYFGSEAGTAQSVEELIVTQPLVSASTVTAGSSVTLTASVRGGTAPYRYGIGFGDPSSVTVERPVSRDGWIADSVTVTPEGQQTEITIVLVVTDAEDRTTSTRSVVQITPATANPPPAGKPQ